MVGRGRNGVGVRDPGSPSRSQRRTAQPSTRRHPIRTGLEQYAEYYGCERLKCAVCHVDKKTLNEYGKALKKALDGEKVITPAMFKACESKRPKS